MEIPPIKIDIKDFQVSTEFHNYKNLRDTLKNDILNLSVRVKTDSKTEKGQRLAPEDDGTLALEVATVSQIDEARAEIDEIAAGSVTRRMPRRRPAATSSVPAPSSTRSMPSRARASATGSPAARPVRHGWSPVVPGQRRWI